MTLQRRPSEHSLDTDEDLLRSKTIAQDSICQIYVLLAIKHYAEATSIDTKHVYQALPRLLSLWFDFTSIEKNVAELQLELQPSQRKLLSANKDKANDVMNEKSKQIPEEAFYTAMAQLISRVIHYDKETALEVRRILIRVLIKFPGQAMWPLAWLRESSDEGRKKIGEILFNDAIRGLEEGPNQTQIKVLVASKSLFNWIYRLAKRDLKITFTNDEPWKGEVDLSEFVPPIQAALSITMPTQTNGRSRDLFPRQVPRMTNFQESVTVTSSSARPKTLKANVIDPREGPCGSHDESRYIGEIHFLVKNEATGDLRKDARVQDLNNVINRLMASSRESKSTSRTRRRLHLRTFAVTCLSEKTGLLEWVPNTESLKSLVQESFNPQAYPYPNRRGGTAKEMVDPTVLEADLRKKYRSCQISAKDEKWTQAANAFEKLCMTYPPRLYWWFCQKFHDPHAWYEARTRFTLSAAAWSAVGYIIGLGDRHTENILVDTTTGECVHVDFDV
jgi:serine/threonine-protein kinase ATR